MTNLKTAIQWTDVTWSPVVGCTRVSPGCAHCYAKTLHDMRHRAHQAGKAIARQYAEPFERVQLVPQRLSHPLSWRAPKRVFVNSVSDLFHDDVPDEFIDQVFAVMALAQRHTFQVLTKRPARMRAYLTSEAFKTNVGTSANLLMDRMRGRAYDEGIAALSQLMLWFDDPNARPGDRRHAIKLASPALPNVWLGVSVENQRFADERIPLLLKTPAAVRFLSCEPLLEEICIAPWLTCRDRGDPQFEVGHGIDWVIVGGESGPKARPFDIRWASSLVAQCREERVRAVPFVKQLGAVPMEPEKDWRGRVLTRLLNVKNRDRVPDGFVPLLCRDKHGGEMAEWPAELRVREMPQGATRAAEVAHG